MRACSRYDRRGVAAVGAILRSRWPAFTLTLVVGCVGHINPEGDSGAPSSSPGSPGAGQTAQAGGASGGSSSGALDCSSNALRPGAPAYRRLNRREYSAAAEALLKMPLPDDVQLPADEQVGTFDSNDNEVPSETTISDYARIAEELAAAAAPRLWSEAGCNAGDSSCPRQLIGSLMQRAFRRPATTDELSVHAALFESASKERDAVQALRLVLQAILQSPHFLFHVETYGVADADGSAPLKATSLAERLSFAIWGSPPDDLLAAAATDGSLETSEGLKSQVDRLLADQRAVEGLGDFVSQWLSLDELDRASVDPMLYPELTSKVRSAMRAEANAVVNQVLTQKGGSLVELFAAPRTVYQPALGALYGVSGQEGVVMDLNPRQRAGILTTPAWLTVTHGAVLRGKVILRDVLCQNVPPPPAGLDTRLAPLAAGQTPRARLEAHASNPECRTCHEQLDAVGFAFETFDEIGRFRSAYPDGAPVDSAGTAHFGGDVLSFSAAPELLAQLAQRAELTECAGEQLFRYLAARSPAEGESCEIAKAVTWSRDKGSDLRELAAALLRSDAFTRVTPAPANSP